MSEEGLVPESIVEIRNSSNIVERPVVSIAPPIGEQIYYTTHDFGDPTTWYSNSIKKTSYALYPDEATGETLWRAHVDEHNLSSDYIVNWIDAMHGKLTNEETELSEYFVQITVDGVSQNILYNDLSGFSWGDDLNDYYPFDFEASSGSVRFYSEPHSGAVVRATFYHLDPALQGSPVHMQSAYRVKVPEGKKIIIQRAEVLATKGVRLNTPLIFDAFVNNPYYNDANPISISNPPMIPIDVATGGALNSRKTFKNFQDILMESTGNFPIIPGGFAEGPRGSSVDLLQVPWNWTQAKAFRAIDHVEIWVYNRSDIPMSNGFVGATFYCEIYDDDEI